MSNTGDDMRPAAARARLRFDLLGPALACAILAYLPTTIATFFVRPPYQLTTAIWLVLWGGLFWAYLRFIRRRA
jgi:hypothetical protein